MHLHEELEEHEDLCWLGQWCKLRKRGYRLSDSFAVTLNPHSQFSESELLPDGKIKPYH